MTTGAGIAAHLTNAGIPVLLLDVVPFTSRIFRGRAARNRFVENLYERMAYADPSAPSPNRTDRRDLLVIGDLKDDFDKIADCDWIIDAMVEPVGLKQLPLFVQKIAQKFFVLWASLRPNSQASQTYPNTTLSFTTKPLAMGEW